MRNDTLSVYGDLPAWHLICLIFKAQFEISTVFIIQKHPYWTQIQYQVLPQYDAIAVNGTEFDFVGFWILFEISLCLLCSFLCFEGTEEVKVNYCIANQYHRCNKATYISYKPPLHLSISEKVSG